MSDAWGPITEDRLTRDVTLVQRKKGHRFSSDDVITAFVAAHTAPEAARVLDLGCGIGSVLLHLAWSLPQATLVGVEAQEISYSLLCENIRRNDLGARVTAHHGDIRDGTRHLGLFPLITGTPPYFPPDTSVEAVDPQRAYARIEFRGGIEAYVHAGAEALAPDGALVLCGDARTDGRLRSAALEVGLHVVAKTSVVAHAPKPPLFAVWTLRWTAAPEVESTFTLRDEAGRTTPDGARLRAFSGFPPLVVSPSVLEVP